RAPREPGDGHPVLGGQRALLVHPVVADTNRRYLLGRPGPTAALAGRTAVTLLATTLDALASDRPADWPAFRALAPHLQALAANPAVGLDDRHLGILLRVTGHTALAYGQMGAAESGIELVTAALGRAWRDGDQPTPATMMVRQQLAYLRGARGREAEAEAIYRDVLQAQLRVWPEADPGSLSTRYNLAASLRDQGRDREAEAAFRGLLADQQRVLGDGHPQTLATRQQLALMLCREEHWAGAEAAFRGLLADEHRALGADHVQTLSTRHNLAQAVRHLGGQRAAEAEVAFRGLLADEQRVLGRDHFLTVATRQFQDGKFVSISLSGTPGLGEQVARSLFGMGVTLGREGRAEAALAAYEQLVAGFAGDSAPALRELVAMALFNTAITLEELGR